MAAGAFVLTNEGKEDLFNEDFAIDDHYWMLILAAHTPNVATDITRADISANECADGDYAKQNASGETCSQTAGTVTIDIGDVDFGNAVTITAKYLYMLRGTVAGTAGTDRIVGYVDLNSGGGSVSSTAGNFDITINASGIVTAT
jgi:hypothetical protein